MKPLPKRAGMLRVNITVCSDTYPLLAVELSKWGGRRGRPTRLCHLATLGLLGEQAFTEGKPLVATRSSNEAGVAASQSFHEANEASGPYRACIDADLLAHLMDDDGTNA